MLLHRLLLSRPQPEVRVCARRQLVAHGVVGQALQGVVVAVLQDALKLGGPDDDALVGAAGGESDYTQYNLMVGTW